MENQHTDDQDYRHDRTAEEFATANPNANDHGEPIVPEHTDKEDQRLDTDPNRYANIEKPGDESANREGSPHVNLSHYSAEDDRVPHPLVNDNGKPEVQTPKDAHDHARKHTANEDQDDSGFFEGL